MTESCPKDGCDYEGKNRMAVGVHWAKIDHPGIPPWKEQTCDWCGGTFERCDSQMTEDGSFCSEECYGKELETRKQENHSSWKGRVTVTCEECDKDYNIRPSRVDRYPHNFCSYSCFVEWRTIHGESRNYSGCWQQQRKKAIIRDRGTCTVDGCERRRSRDGRGLTVHHIKPYRSFDDPEEANRLENLRCCCSEHHKMLETQ